jgi:DNA ligase-1
MNVPGKVHRNIQFINWVPKPQRLVAALFTLHQTNMIPQDFKPLLAVEHSKVKTQPDVLFMSEKLDGIRCIVFGGVPYSRSLKPIPNKFIQAYVRENAKLLEGVDCEIIVGDKNAPDVFNQSTSGCMRFDGEPDFTLWAFDKYHPFDTWWNRYNALLDSKLPDRCRILIHQPAPAQDVIDAFEKECLDAGAEGIMLRDANGKYKHGRSGTKTPEIQKVKRFVDSEFIIIGWEPKYHNTNEAKTNELGRTERSSAKDGLVALDTMGALLLKMEDGTEFSCGSGFTDNIRVDLWNMRDELAGKWAKVKYFDVGSGYTVPRFPTFLGLRDERDM